MKRRLIVLLVLAQVLISSCSNKISPFFEGNRYISDFSYHIVNDTLKVYHKSLGDFDYITDEKHLKKQLKKKQLNNVLVYGKTNLDPFYEYYLLFNADKEKIAISEFTYVKDTIINGNHFLFLGRGLNDNFPSRDFKYIAESLIVGDAYRKEFVSLNDILIRNRKSNKFFQSFIEISEYPAIDNSEEWFKLQFQLTYLSFLGKNSLYDEFLKKWESNYRINDTIKSLIRDKAINGESKVIQEILKLTIDEKLIMFNENHFYPNHRKLITKLLPELKKQGFKYLALEALATDSLINQQQTPNLESGFYTKEQNYFELLQEAQELGFVFISYENENEKINREIGQAQNLFNKSFAFDKEAKVIVYAGIAHITEKTDNHGNKWMAQIFKEKYGIDPLTFSQTDLKAYSKIIDGELAILESDILNADYYKTVDYHIVNNIYWSTGIGNFTYKNNYTELIQIAIFDNSDFKTERSYWNKIPEKSYLLKPEEEFSTLLNHSNYRLIVFDKKGKVLENRMTLHSPTFAPDMKK